MMLNRHSHVSSTIKFPPPSQRVRTIPRNPHTSATLSGMGGKRASSQSSRLLLVRGRAESGVTAVSSLRMGGVSEANHGKLRGAGGVGNDGAPRAGDLAQHDGAAMGGGNNGGGGLDNDVPDDGSVRSSLSADSVAGERPGTGLSASQAELERQRRRKQDLLAQARGVRDDSV